MATRVAHGIPTEHLPAMTVAAYLRGQLDPDRRAEASEHLAGCAMCRHEVVAVGRLLARRRRQQAVPVLGLAAAAALVLAVGLPAIRRSDAPGGEAVRAPVSWTTAALATIAPAADTILAANERVRFAWHAVPGGSTYRVMLLGASGERLWSAETGDTVVNLPEHVRLAPATSYFWYVDALTADGASRTSGARRFSLR